MVLRSALVGLSKRGTKGGIMKIINSIATMALAVLTVPAQAATTYSFHLQPGVRSPDVEVGGGWAYLDFTFDRAVTGQISIYVFHVEYEYENFMPRGVSSFEFHIIRSLAGVRPLPYALGSSSTFNPVSGNGWIETTSLTGSVTLAQNEMPAQLRVVSLAGGVPEPSTWLILIAGFAIIGGAQRRTMTRRPKNSTGSGDTTISRSAAA